MLRFRSFVAEQNVEGSWVNAVTKVNHYGDDSDEPRWIAEDVTLPSNVTRMISSPEGDLAVTTGQTGAVTLQLTSLHGDVMATVPVTGGVLGAVTVLDADEYGVPSAETPAAATARYGWLGGKQRSGEALGGVLLMGVRLYHPGSGRFWSPDPEPGGNATSYDYCSGDPVNGTDLDGRWPSLRSAISVVAKGAELASWIPGPVGSVGAVISAGAYAANGNYRKAAEMGVVAAANLVGAGAAVKVGIKVAKVAARSAPKAAARVPKVARAASTGCRNSFTPETRVLMADGSTKPISHIGVGDKVWATTPETGESSAEPVLNVIIGYGTKQLVRLDTDPTTPDAVTATADHPVWVEGRGWTEMANVRPADRFHRWDGTIGAGGIRVLGSVDDQLVYNLHVGNRHTFSVLAAGGPPIVAHNVSGCGAAGQAVAAWMKKYASVRNTGNKAMTGVHAGSRRAAGRLADGIKKGLENRGFKCEIRPMGNCGHLHVDVYKRLPTGKRSKNKLGTVHITWGGRAVQ